MRSRTRSIAGTGILLGMLVALSSASVAPRATTVQAASLRGLPLTTRAAISKVLGREDTAYAVAPIGDGYRSENPAQEITAEFDASGVRLRHGDDSGVLELSVTGTPAARAGSSLQSRRRLETAWNIAAGR